MPQISARLRRLLRPKLPSVVKLMPVQDAGKKLRIERCLFAQEPDAFAILVPLGPEAH